MNRPVGDDLIEQRVMDGWSPGTNAVHPET